MKKLCIFSLFLFVSIFILNSSCISQKGWQWVNPYPSNKDINNLQFVNASTGFASINYKIFKTTDCGLHWNIPGDTIGWYDFNFIDASTGITLSTDGIYKTTNSGLNWNLINSIIGIPNSSNYQMDFLNSSVGCYTFTTYSPFGPVGQIEVTTNGGVNWFYPYFQSTQNFSGIRFVSRYNTYALGLDSASIYLYKSYDPTGSWFRLPTGLNNSTTPSLFVKDSNTVFVSTTYTILSTNAGYNWINTELGNIKDIKFINSNTGIATGFNHQIFRSTNGGFNWSQIQSPVNYDFNSISFGGASTVYISGKLGSVLKSTDLGLTWTTNANYFTLKDFNDFCMLGKDTLIIVADSGYVFRSTNQGLNWQTSIISNHKMFRKIFFLDKSTGFAVGDSGTLIKTTNSGLNWNLLNLGYYDNFVTDVFFLNQNTGFICGGGAIGNIYRTTNAGTNWTILSRPSNGNYYFIRFFNSNTGFTSCWEKIFRTTNLGDNWTQMNTEANSEIFYDLTFINNTTGFTSGGDGYIHKTTDGGFNWIRTSKLVYSDVFRIKFLNEQTGYATAGYGFSGNMSAIFSTTNGGDSWERMYIPMNTNSEKLSAIDFCDANTGFVVGDYGIVFKTTTGGFVFANKIEEKIPEKFYLSQNYPNPFNPTTKIRYSIPQLSSPYASGGDLVLLKIYDILGKEITTLVNEKQSPGVYEVSWEASHYPSGVYFYKLIAGDFSETKKMVLLK